MAVYFDRTGSNSNKMGEGVHIHGFVRQARNYQQHNYLVGIDAPNATYKPGRDIVVDLWPWPDEDAPQSKNPDDTSRWNAMGGTVGTRWVAPGSVASNAWPTALERSGFLWKGCPIDEIHSRTQPLRVSILNPYDEETLYAISTVAVTRTVTAAAWASGSNTNKDNLVTYTYSGATLVGTLTVNHAVRITGCAQAANNGTFNIESLTSSTVTVHNYARSSTTGNETGITASMVGPSPRLILDDAHPGRTYIVRVTAKAGSTEDLRVVNAAGTAVKTITATGNSVFRKSPSQGWVEVV